MPHALASLGNRAIGYEDEDLKGEINDDFASTSKDDQMTARDSVDRRRVRPNYTLPRTPLCLREDLCEERRQVQRDLEHLSSDDDFKMTFSAEHSYKIVKSELQK